MNLRQIPIPTWTEPATLKFLRDLGAQSKFLIESGCYMGASAREMLIGSPDNHLWTIDKFMVFGTKEVTELFLSEWIEAGRCEIIQGDMDKAGKMLIHMRRQIDAAFVDDGHAVEDVQRDIRNLLPLLRPGAILCGHDWEGDNDVAQGVMSMLPKDKLFFPCPRLWAYKKP